MSKYSYKESFEYDINNSDAGINIHDKYHFLTEIHRSEHSIITKVSCKSSEEIFILKAVKKRADFVIDMDRLKNLDIEGVNRIHEVYESEQFVYFIESFIEGDNLEIYVHEKGALERDEAKSVILKVADTLNRLHQFGEKVIVFRDLKPSNIMIEPNGNITLIDIVTIRETKENQTQDTFLIGSKGYTAPEAYGFMQTSVLSDMYSLGATLFFLLTGTQPANVSSFKSYFDEHKDLPYKDIIEKATAFVPKDRFQNVDAFIAAMNQGRVKKSKKKWLFVAFLILMMGSAYVVYLESNKPEEVKAEVTKEIKQIEDIDFDHLAVLEQNNLKFELYSDGLLKVYIDKESLDQTVADFSYISVGTGYVPYSPEMIKNDIFLSTMEKGYQLYHEDGFNSALDDRKSILIILFSTEGVPIAYYSSDDVTQFADKIDFNELNPMLKPIDTFEVADGVNFSNYENYTVLKVDQAKVPPFTKVSVWNKHSPYAGEDIAKVQEKIEKGENVILYTEEGVKVDYGISGTFLGDYWLIYLLDENNNIKVEYRTEGMYQISQPSLQIEKSIDLDTGVVLHVLGTYTKLEVDPSIVPHVTYAGMYQQQMPLSEQKMDQYKQAAESGVNISAYTEHGADFGYDESGIFDDSYWYVLLLDENRKIIKAYTIER